MRKESKEMIGKILTVVGVVGIISVALHMIKLPWFAEKPKQRQGFPRIYSEGGMADTMKIYTTKPQYSALLGRRVSR